MTRSFRSRGALAAAVAAAGLLLAAPPAQAWHRHDHDRGCRAEHRVRAGYSVWAGWGRPGWAHHRRRRAARVYVVEPATRVYVVERVSPFWFGAGPFYGCGPCTLGFAGPTVVVEHRHLPHHRRHHRHGHWRNRTTVGVQVGLGWVFVDD